MESTYYMENYGGYITFVFSQNAKQIGIETLVYIIPIGFIQVIFFKKADQCENILTMGEWPTCNQIYASRSHSNVPHSQTSGIFLSIQN